MDVQFVASVAPIVRDADAARAFYRDALGLSFEGEAGDYLFTHELEGTKHFGLWPLAEAATACFGTNLFLFTPTLNNKGCRLIHEARTEPWGQITARLLSPEGLLVAVCYTPAFHDASDT